MALQIRKCTKDDEEGIINVCFRTGYMGEDLTNINKFNDKILFGYLFCSYYPRYEPENCFVAVDGNGSVFGYILGTADSDKQEKEFVFKMVWRIILRLIFYSSWKYPESFRAFFYMIRNGKLDSGRKKIFKEYPAHLHINVLPEYQHSGTGALLIQSLENDLGDKGIKGIHLGTSNHNFKALPFYTKRGYKIISSEKSRLWKGVEDYESIIFAKKLPE